MHHTLITTTLALLATAAGTQEMPAPQFKPGDHWNYRETDLLTKNETGHLGETVTAVEGDTYWIDARRQARTWWRGDASKALHVEQFAHAEGAPGERGKSLTSNDGGCAYPWPLKPGQKFNCSETVLFPNGWKVRYDLKYEVEAAEPLDLPAGRFDTLRLVAKGWANNLTTNSNSRHERVIWLAPAAKREVKHEIRTFLPSGRPFRVEGRELVQVKLAD
ncbi:hypothetical protein BurJ1DRAFT_0814 [Burkholderiales bacterium JOSHI_001]|nr:hypothetical protein BurJ1DRAFT_0814 [Burkholderiales bacterium JOSHI_001]